ncbi:MAG TPA: hypothetical protein EYQ00_02330, partial [Dehalococcoidia bacterium]|nr:hypothetical protein [Dehalococcoidia bacterium]
MMTNYMNDEMPTTTLLKDYTPPPYLITHIDLTVEIFPSHTEVKSRLDVSRNSNVSSHSPLILNGCDLELVCLSIDNLKLSHTEYTTTDEHLTINGVPETFVLETVVQIQPTNNTRLEGLYASKDGLFTQCEAEGFRRITYFLDRPDVMSRYTTTIVADPDQYPVLLSNGNLEAGGKNTEGKHWARWVDPFLLAPLSRLASQQTTPTRRTMEDLDLLLQFVAWTPPPSQTLRRCHMTL